MPKHFPIPDFRISTENNFKDGILTDSDRKYVVQTMSTILMTYISKPSLRDCEIVAKALIDKFGFLRDGEGDGDVSNIDFFLKNIQQRLEFSIHMILAPYHTLITQFIGIKMS